MAGVQNLYISLQASLHLASFIATVGILSYQSRAYIGRCQEHQAHLVWQGIQVDNQNDWLGEGDQLVGHSVDWMKSGPWLIAAPSVNPANGADLYWSDEVDTRAVLSDSSYIKNFRRAALWFSPTS